MEYVRVNADLTETRISTEDTTQTATSNYIGDPLKTGYNKINGYTKFDYRPTGGGTNSYAVQVRMESGAASGSVIGIDNETHLKEDGTASIRSTQGVAVVDADVTATGSTVIGTYGQARVDGTMAGNSFLAALYGLIEAGTAITANHVTSLWLDSHQAEAVTGAHDLLYMTNNGAATMDQAIHVYGGDKIASLIKLDTCEGMVADTATTDGASKKIKIDIDGVTYYINAYAGA